MFTPTIDMNPIWQLVSYPPYWRFMERDPAVDPATAILEMQPWAKLRKLTPQIIDEIQKCAGFSKNPQNAARLRLEAMYLVAGREQFLHPELGRPTWAFKSAFQLVLLFKHLLGVPCEWLTNELGRKFTLARLTHFPQEIRSAMELWFGENSVGWMNYAEYEDAVKVLTALIEQNDARNKILDYWKKWEGEEAVFDQAWETFLTEMRVVRDELEKIQPDKSTSVRYSASYYEKELRLRGCTDSMCELAARAAEEWATLNEMANSLAVRAGYTDWQDWLHNFRFTDETIALLCDDQALLSAYSDGSSEVLRIMRDLGLLSVVFPKNYGWGVELITSVDGSQSTTASCHPGVMTDNPENPLTLTIRVGGWEHLQGDAAANHQRHQSQLWWITLWHEMVHVLQHFLQPSRIVRAWTWTIVTNISMEGSAFAAELLMLQNDPQNIYLLLGVLQHRMKRLGRIIVENMYLNGTSFDDVVKEYMKLTGFDEHSARVECQRMTTTPLQFSSYVLGSWILEKIAEQYFGGDLAQCWKVYMEETAGFIPANFWAAVRGDTQDPNMSWTPSRNWLAEYIRMNWAN